MEESGNQTFMCCVLFLDIVEYSKKSVTGQISLKERFISYLSAAIRDVPLADRIILDTGDGAAINFLGDVEDALKVALSLRESLLIEDPDVNHPLLMRMGINLGPVRLVRDDDGQPNVVGDGINVAQRIMGFADAGQILVSRSYYDAVSRLSTQYAGMFHYQGSRTDKHVREHEIYAIGYPGDKSMQQITTGSTESTAGTVQHLINRFRRAEPKQRAQYVVAVAVYVLLLITLAWKLVYHNQTVVAPDSIDKRSASTARPASAVAAPVQAGSANKVKDSNKHQVATAARQKTQKVVEGKKTGEAPQHTENQPKTQDAVATHTAVATPGGGSRAYISVNCMEGTEVLVDGAHKGRISSWPFTIAITPGKHTVAVNPPRAEASTQNVVIEAGKTLRIEPGSCN